MEKRTRLDMVKEISDRAQVALESIDKDLADEHAVEIDKKVYISHAGVLDCIILLAQEVIKSKEKEMEVI